MILTCPSCGSRFQIPDGALGAAGRKVKCSACQHVWFQAAEAVAADTPPPTTVEAAPGLPDSDSEPAASAETGGDSRAQAAPDTATSSRDEPPSGQASVEKMILGTSGGVPSEDAPDFDVSRVVGPDDADRRSSGSRGWTILLIVLLVIAAGSALYKWRAEVLQAFPETLPAYTALNLVGPPSSQNLKLEDVSFEVMDDGGYRVLIVSGRVVNAGPEVSLLPMLRAEFLDQAGQVTAFWTFVATAEVLAPGGYTGFRDIYPDPPVTGNETDILVTFDDLR